MSIIYESTKKRTKSDKTRINAQKKGFHLVQAKKKERECFIDTYYLPSFRISFLKVGRNDPHTIA